MFAAFLLTFGFLRWHSHARCPYFPEMMSPQCIHTSYHMYCLWWIWVASPNIPEIAMGRKNMQKGHKKVATGQAWLLACGSEPSGINWLSWQHLFTIWCLFPDGSIITWYSIVLVWGPLAKLLLGWFAWFAYIWMQNRPKLTTFGYVWHLPQSCFRTVEGSDAASSGSLFGGSSSSSQESQRFASKGWDAGAVRNSS